MLENMGQVTDTAFRAKVRFLRQEAARNGRDPAQITISNSIFAVVLADSASAAQASARATAAALGIAPEEVPRCALFLIGTPQQCVGELKRRAGEWNVGQFIFGTSDATLMRRLAAEVMPSV
jgi:alkanesulfonate monooxygenase SsuD/methylene tetrahydromethanopterin reductase-like flavin-dependent oxidoreductase (luciferase family)